MMGYGWGMGVGGWIMMVAFWVLLVGAVVVLAAWLLPGPRDRARGRPETPEEILDRRFALGEIDEDQYRKARDELTAARSGRR
jgi:putative membrane protein